MRAPPMSLAPAALPPSLAAERPEDAGDVAALVLRAFGPGRYAKAAERLREGREPVRALSFLAWEDGALVGCVRLWRVTVGTEMALLLGPIAVEASCRSQGLGGALVDEACAAAAAQGCALIVLVGDMPFFGPHGFSPAPKVVLPGPVDQRRVLARRLGPGAVEPEGAVAAA